MAKINIKKLPKSEIEIEGEIEADIFESFYEKALKKIGENVELPGFRKGKVPENILIANIKEPHILEEMAEMALGEHYPKILEEHKIDAITRPEIMITKLARKNPLTFKVKTAIMPEIKLPDYKEIAKKFNTETKEKDIKIEVTEKEVEDTIMDIRKSRAKKVHMKDEAHTHVHKDGEIHDHSHKHEEELPEFNDEFVRSLGPFKDIADFKDRLKENIKLEKQNQEKEKNRLKIIEKIIDDFKVDLPDVFVEVELDKIMYRMESDITGMGLKFEDYLKHLNKTVEDVRKEFRNDAEKKAKIGLILNEIASLEKITPNEKQVELEVATILEHYKDADPTRAKLHAENVLTNEEVFRFLENQ